MVRKYIHNITDYIASKRTSPYRFVPVCFIFGALTELFMIKAPLAGKGETFYDVARRKESERQFKRVFGKLPDDSGSVEEILTAAVSEQPVEHQESSELKSEEKS